MGEMQDTMAAEAPAWQPTGIFHGSGAHIARSRHPATLRENQPHPESPLLAGNRRYAVALEGIARTSSSPSACLCRRLICLTCIAANIAIDDKRVQFRVSPVSEGNATDRRSVRGAARKPQSIQARLSDAEIARRAQNVMFDAEYLAST
jgi:hypothetical protein